MLHPIIRQVDEDVADRMLAMRTYLTNAGVTTEHATTLTAAAFTGHALPLVVDHADEGTDLPGEPG